MAAWAATIAVLVLSPAGGAQTLPAGFADELVAQVGTPTGFAHAPDGRILVTTQPGRLRVIANGVLVEEPALDLSTRVCTQSDRGLLGVALDPSFTTNGFVYVFYTAKVGATCPTRDPWSPVDRISRFTLSRANRIDPASEMVLVDNIPNYSHHNAGDLFVGQDGYLYATTGDGGCDYADAHLCNADNDAAQDRAVLAGKVLRITREGGVPAENPFLGEDSVSCSVSGRSADRTKACREIFALGLRNPFRFAFDPNADGTRFYVNDVGLRSWDEIDEGVTDANYGWPLREGPCTAGSTAECPPPPPGFTDPVFAYGYGDGCRSITGGAFAPYGAWPTSYDGAYFFADYVCGKIFRLVPSATGGFVREEFAALGGNSATTLAFAAAGNAHALYYTSYANGGEVRRIVYRGTANRTPSARVTASASAVVAPAFVTFDANASSDPNPGDALTYEWTFGDGSPVKTTTTSSVAHTYADPGTYIAEVRVQDVAGARSLPARITIEVAPDASPPEQAPVLASSHTSGWSNDPTVEVTWSGASDGGSGVDGFSYEWSQNPTAVADTIKDAEETATGTTSPPLADGEWWFHLRTGDYAGNWSSPVRLGPFKIDTRAPTVPVLSSVSHTVAAWSNDPTVDLAWTEPSEGGSGIDGFSFEWSQSAGTEPDAVKDAEEAARNATVSASADGEWWFHLRARDNAGNWSAPVHLGPFRIDTTAPKTMLLAGPPSETADRSAEFAFTSNEPASSFACSLDGAAYSPCSSPTLYASLEPGAHTFRVRAQDRAGNIDPAAAERAWTITSSVTPPAPPPSVPPPPPVSPPAPPPPPRSPPDTTPPQTRISNGPHRVTRTRRATFRFRATGERATFECKLDRRPWTRCRSPITYARLRKGRHTFKVRATDAAGNRDRTPATRTWRIR